MNFSPVLFALFISLPACSAAENIGPFQYGSDAGDYADAASQDAETPVHVSDQKDSGSDPKDATSD